MILYIAIYKLSTITQLDNRNHTSEQCTLSHCVTCAVEDFLFHEWTAPRAILYSMIKKYKCKLLVFDTYQDIFFWIYPNFPHFVILFMSTCNYVIATTSRKSAFSLLWLSWVPCTHNTSNWHFLFLVWERSIMIFQLFYKFYLSSISVLCFNVLIIWSYRFMWLVLLPVVWSQCETFLFVFDFFMLLTMVDEIKSFQLFYYIYFFYCCLIFLVVQFHSQYKRFMYNAKVPLTYIVQMSQVHKLL